MIEKIADAFDRQDYHTVAELLKPLLQDSPQNPWVQFYLGRLHEVSGKWEEATTIYRQLLRDTINSKIVAQARQGLQRLEALAQAQRQQAIAEATAESSNSQLGLLILEPVASENKTVAAQQIAAIMHIDPYTARLQLPSRGWRLCRTGAIGEMRLLGQNLCNSNVPCFWATLDDIQNLRVFQVSYFNATDPVTVICQNEAGELDSLTFNWSEVSDRVTGLLPIFEQVVDLDPRGKLQRKTKTQDYAYFYDLHLRSRNCILRVSDRTYQFQEGITFTQQQPLNNQTTIRISWNSLINFFDQQMSDTMLWSDFTCFAETVLDQTELLRRIKSHVNLFRRTETPWDSAFHLYSGLAFIKGAR